MGISDGNGGFSIKLTFGQWIAVAAWLVGGGIGWGMLKSDIDSIKQTLTAVTTAQAAAVVQMRDMHDEIISLKIEGQVKRR